MEEDTSFLEGMLSVREWGIKGIEPGTFLETI